MCSVGDDIEEGPNKLMPESSTLKLISKNCVKCKTELPKLVINSVYPYCKDCFLASVTHKFKVSLGRTRLTHCNGKVLVKYETGHPSTALLHLLYTGMNLTAPKRILLLPSVIFIEKNYHLSVAERRELLQKVSEEASSYEFPVYFFPFIEYLRHSDYLSKYLTQDWKSVVLSDTDGNDLVEDMKGRPLTNQKEFCDIMERELLNAVAIMLTCNSIFLPNIMTSIATEVLSVISLGRGATASADTGLVDRRFEVEIFRPLRCLTTKEVALYNFYSRLNPVTFLPEQENASRSVQSLMKTFVTDLQDNYPATISTIVRTGDRLSACADSSGDRCLTCQTPLRHQMTPTLQAVRFSQWISQHQRGEADLNDYGYIIEEPAPGEKYCFSCQRMANYVKNNEPRV